jgi:hypothetical protein
VTEGNGHVIDPGGDAHRALQAAVAEHGPEVLSNTAIMNGICRELLSAQPSEATLIGTAARADVPALLQEQISRLGNYGGIQSVASTLAGAHGLDLAESLWVVREYARAMGLIAAGGTRAPRRMSGDAEAGVAGAVGAGAVGAGVAGAGADTALNRVEERPDDPGDAVLNRVVERPDDPSDTVLNQAVERPDDPSDTVLNQAVERPDDPSDTVLNQAVERPDDPSDTVLSEIPRPVSGSGEAGPGETALSEAAGSQPGPGDTMLSEAAASDTVTPGETVHDKAVRNEASLSEDWPSDTILDGTADDEPGPGGTVISPVGGGQAPPVETPLVEAPLVEAPPVEIPPVEAPLVEAPQSATVLSEAAGGMAAGGVAATAAGGIQAPESEATPDPDPVAPAGGVDGPSGDGGPSWAGAQSRTNEAGEGAWPVAGERPGGSWGDERRETWEPAAGNAVFGGYQQGPPPAGPVRGGGPGYPPGPPGGDGYPPPQPLPYATPKSNRNRNILGIVAALALVAVYLGIAAVAHLSPFPAKTTAAASTPPPSQTSGTNPSPSTSPTATATPTPTQPTEVLLAKIPANIAGTNNCKNIGTAAGATARLQCTGFQGPATGILYYLYSDANALSKGFDTFLTSAKFKVSSKSCTTNGQFVKFVVQCEDTFSNQTPATAGRIAEYQRVNDFDPIIASTDTPQLVMAVLVGTNDASLLSYWKQFEWIKS